VLCSDLFRFKTRNAHIAMLHVASDMANSPCRSSDAPYTSGLQLVGSSQIVL